MRQRVLVVVSLLAAVSACHPPSLTSRAKSLGSRTLALVKPLAPTIHLDARVQVVATDALRAKAQQRVAAQEPIVIGTSIRSSRPEPQAQAPADVPVTIHRTQAPPSVFVLHGTTFGGTAFCQQFTTMDTCTTSCTNMLRAHGWNPNAASDPDGTKSCSCLELDRGS